MAPVSSTSTLDDILTAFPLLCDELNALSFIFPENNLAVDVDSDSMASLMFSVDSESLSLCRSLLELRDRIPGSTPREKACLTNEFQNLQWTPSSSLYLHININALQNDKVSDAKVPALTMTLAIPSAYPAATPTMVLEMKPLQHTFRFKEYSIALQRKLMSFDKNEDILFELLSFAKDSLVEFSNPTHNQSSAKDLSAESEHSNDEMEKASSKLNTYYDPSRNTEAVAPGPNVVPLPIMIEEYTVENPRLDKEGNPCPNSWLGHLTSQGKTIHPSSSLTPIEFSKKNDSQQTPLIGKPRSHIKIGLVGLPNVGKSSLFNLISGLQVPAANYAFCTIDPNIATVPIMDEKYTLLKSVFSPEESIPPVISLVDIAGLVKGASQGRGLGNAFLHHISTVQVIFQVVRFFEDLEVEHVEGNVNPIRDIEIITRELLEKDLEQMNNRISRLNSKRSKVFQSLQVEKSRFEELSVLLKAHEWLRSGRALRHCDWNSAELAYLSTLQLWTSKPVCFVVNLSAMDYFNPRIREAKCHIIRKWCKKYSPDAKVLPISIRYEQTALKCPPGSSSAFISEVTKMIEHYDRKAKGLSVETVQDPEESKTVKEKAEKTDKKSKKSDKHDKKDKKDHKDPAKNEKKDKKDKKEKSGSTSIAKSKPITAAVSSKYDISDLGDLGGFADFLDSGSDEAFLAPMNPPVVSLSSMTQEHLNQLTSQRRHSTSSTISMSSHDDSSRSGSSLSNYSSSRSTCSILSICDQPVIDMTDQDIRAAVELAAKKAYFQFSNAGVTAEDEKTNETSQALEAILETDIPGEGAGEGEGEGEGAGTGNELGTVSRAFDAQSTSSDALFSLIKTGYVAAQLIYFFTCDRYLVRGYMLPSGTKLARASSRLHYDNEKRFLSAEVCSYHDWVSNNKSLTQAKNAGLVRVHGKDYVVQDGDIIKFKIMAKSKLETKVK